MLTGEQLLTIFESLPDLTIFKDMQGRWMYANQIALQVLQINENDYQGKTAQELFHAAHPHHLAMLACEKMDEQVWFNNTPVTMEIKLVHSNGQDRVYELMKIPVLADEATHKGLVVIGKDITEKQNADDRLRLAAKAFENVGDGVVITDLDGTIEFVNPAFTAVTGYGSEEVLGKNPRLLKSGRHGPLFYQSMWDSITLDGHWQGEIWNHRKDGQSYLEWLTITAIKNEQGQTIHYLATFRDISEQENVRKEAILAGRVQRQLLPSDYQGKNVSIRTVYKPHLYVSGDLFDYFWIIPDTHLFGYVIDVMGHGISTALQTSVLRVLIHQAATMNLPLDEKLKWINKETNRFFVDDTFAAVICFEFDFIQKKLVYCSAGINFFLRGKHHYSEVIKSFGTYVGLFEDVDFVRHEIQFESGDCFCFLTDGVFDLPTYELQDFLKKEVFTFEKIREYILSKKRVDDASLISFQIE